jgi:hypothetical protein
MLRRNPLYILWTQIDLKTKNGKIDTMLTLVKRAIVAV